MPKILTADDSLSIRQMVSHTLKDAGYEVDTANDGADALHKAKQQRYDVIISDVNMPNVDGLELVRQLRANPQYKFTPILMLTTEASSDKKTAGKQAGATGWIVKPFNPDTLLKTLGRVI